MEENTTTQPIEGLSEEEQSLLDSVLNEVHEGTSDNESTNNNSNGDSSSSNNTVETIPENSPTLNTDNTSSRFSSANWYEEAQKYKITLAGLGGIGRF